MPTASCTTRADFSRDSDEDLLVYMSMQADDRSSAEDAWEEFYKRHEGYLMAVCGRSFRVTLGDLGVQDLVQDTFVRVFQKAHTYKPVGVSSEDRARANVRGWLGKIANNLFLSSLRRQPQVDYLDDPFATIVDKRATEEATETQAGESEELSLLRKALQTLTEREREVLIASYAWYEAGTGCKKMPTEELKGLMERFQTTDVNIRQIRSRAFRKLEQYLQDQSNA